MTRALKINEDGSLGWEQQNKYRNQPVLMCVRCCHVVESKGDLDCCNWKNPKKIVRFMSGAEAMRYVELKMLEDARMIEKLELQPRFPFKVNGKKVCTYVSDFSYIDKASRARVVEDVKSKPTRTEAYKIKKKLLHALYGIEVTEVEV